MKNWVIIYNNGYIETSERLPQEYLHLIDIGIIKYAIYTKENRVMIPGSDGCMKEIKATEIKH